MADPQDVQKRRAREIAGHLSGARQAFVARNYEGTLLACEKVLLLDPQNVEALDLLDLARTTNEEQRLETVLTQARQALDQEDIGKASDLIDQALAVDRTSSRPWRSKADAHPSTRAGTRPRTGTRRGCGGAGADQVGRSELRVRAAPMVP